MATAAPSKPGLAPGGASSHVPRAVVCCAAQQLERRSKHLLHNEPAGGGHGLGAVDPKRQLINHALQVPQHRQLHREGGGHPKCNQSIAAEQIMV